MLLPAAILSLLGCSSTTSGPNTPAPSVDETTSETSPEVSPTSVIVPVDATGFPNPCQLVTREEADAHYWHEIPGR